MGSLLLFPMSRGPLRAADLRTQAHEAGDALLEALHLGLARGAVYGFRV